MYQIKYPIAFHPVDMAITRTHEGRVQVLLAQKVKDAAGGKNVWRFPGGFIDPWDSCAEEAALREAMEETGMKFINSSIFSVYFAMKKPLTDKITKHIESQGIVMSELDGRILSELISKIQAIDITEEVGTAALPWLRKNITYLGSTKIDDIRYRDSDHKVITSFYELHPVSGNSGEGPFDDIARTKWFFLSDIKEEIMHPSHKVLFSILFEKYKTEKIVDEVLEHADKLVNDVEDMFTSFKKNADDIFGEVKKKMPEFEKKANETMGKVNERMKKMFESINF
jgi:8-oxo-dGTP pyrophosphatase MutT (NUDIX family)